MRTTFRGSSGAHVLDLTRADDSVAPAFGSWAPGPPAGRLLAVIGAAYQEEQEHPRVALLGAAAEFVEALDRQRDLLPYRYSYRVGAGAAAAGMGGLRIRGKPHVIRAGPGLCYLQEMEVGPDGRGRVVRTTDIRGERRVDADDSGPVTVYRRKLKLTLWDAIPRLVAFLRDSPDDVLRVLTTERRASLMDLVRAAAAGGGAEDWAEEELAALGPDARAALIDRLGDAGARGDFPAIARVLLTVFPSAESRRAVEGLADREADPERRAGYLVLLACAPPDG